MFQFSKLIESNSYTVGCNSSQNNHSDKDQCHYSTVLPFNNSLKMMKFMLVSIMAKMLIVTASVKAHLFAAAISGHEARRMQTTCTRSNSSTCKNGFCGTHNQCHESSCPAFFQQGGRNAESIGSTTLACEDYSTGDQDGKYAVLYSCQGYSNIVIPLGKGYGQAFNRKCSATIGMQLFECYDLKPNTDYSYFMSLVDSDTPLTCTNSSDGFDGPANFIYQVIYAYDCCTVFESFSAATYNQSLTLFTMSAKLTDIRSTTNPTLAPTQSPTEASPTIYRQTSGVPIITPSYATAALVGLMAFLI
jgi:hypothetical protein